MLESENIVSMARPVFHPQIHVLASMRASGGQRLNVALRGLTKRGFWCEFASELCVGDQVWLKFGDFNALEVLVTERVGYDYRCSFFHPLHPAIYDHVTTRFGRELLGGENGQW